MAVYIYTNMIDDLANIDGAPRGLGDLGRMAIYFQGAGEHC